MPLTLRYGWPTLLLLLSLPAPARGEKIRLDLAEVIEMGQRLGAAGQFRTYPDYAEAVKTDFLRIYRRQVDGTNFLAYPSVTDVSTRILTLCRHYLQVNAAIQQLKAGCSDPTKARFDAELLRRVRMNSARVRKDFNSMFLEYGAHILPEDLSVRSMVKGQDFCRRVELLSQLGLQLRVHVVEYFFGPSHTDAATLDVGKPSIQILTLEIENVALRLASP